ncbi:MAG: GNAT family N-acetyltransferase [Nocardioides sp.]
MQLRFATHGAAAGWAAVQRSASPFLVGSEESVLHDMTHHAATLARYVVVEDGAVLGLTRVRAAASLREVRVMLQVHADHRGRGVGTRLLEQALRVADGRSLAGVVNGDDYSVAVSDHWGFARERSHRISTVDPREAPAPRATPEGLAVVPLATLDAALVWACLQEVALDDPSGLTRPVPLAEFLDTEWSDPLHRADLGRAAVTADGTVAAYAQITAADDRAWNAMTGTLPAYRGRGLATLVKAHALAACAAAGITSCGTGNDDANAPMLAVNGVLGYRPSAVTWSARRPAGA